MLATLEAKLIAGTLALLALLAGALWLVRDLEASGAAKATVAQAKAAAEAEAQALADSVRRAQIQQGNFDATEHADQARADDARAGAAALQRLLDQPRSARVAGAAGTPASAASDASSLPAAADLSPDLRAQRDELAADLLDIAVYADCLRSGGQLCADDYHALSASSLEP